MPAEPDRIAIGERRAVIALVALAVVALGVRVVAIVEPLGIDQSLWASAARAMARGQLLYRDVWEQRPPGIYFTYLAGFSLFGWREATVVWLDLLAAATTTVFVFDVGRLLGRPLTGAVAAASFAVLTMPASLYGYGGFLERSVCETFTVAWVALGASAAARIHRGASRPVLLLVVVGLATGIAVIYKPNAGLYVPALALWLFCYWRPAGSVAVAGARGPSGRPSRPGLRPFVILAAAAALPTIGILLWLVSLGIVADARVAIVDFNRFYVASGVTIDALGVAFAKAVWLRMKTHPLWAAGGAGALVAVALFMRHRRLDPLPGLLVIWGAAAACVIFVNGIRLFPAYFINPFPPLALMTAWILVGERGGSPVGRVGRVAVLVLLAGLMVWRGFVPRVVEAARADWSVIAGHIDRTSYLERFGGYGGRTGYSARANEELARYIASRTTVDQRIFLFGINGAGVYFLADRLLAHRFIRVNFFVPEAFPNPAFTRAAVVAEVEAARPVYVVFERLHTASEIGRQIDALPSHPHVAPWLNEHYALETTIEDFAIYRRR